MPETKINLPSFLIADLYKDNLVVPDAPAVAAAAVIAPVRVVENEDDSEAVETIISAPKIVDKKTMPVPANWYLGDNRKNVVVIVKDDEAIFLEEESLAQLTGMLTACKLTLADVAIVNVFNTPKTFNEIHNALLGKQYILFGISTSDIDLPFAFPFYQLQQFNNATFVSAPPLQLLKANTVTAKTEKSKLWLCLKQIFNV